jgi:hypothetical protein
LAAITKPYGDLEGDTRRPLGEEGYERVRADGYAMTGEEAVAHALEHGD